MDHGSLAVVRLSGRSQTQAAVLQFAWALHGMHAMYRVNFPRCVDSDSGETRSADVKRPHPIRMRPVCTRCEGRFGLKLLVGGFRTFVEALDDAAELHRRYVWSCRTRCAGEGERVL
jgi:hypothetical protein